MEDRNNKFIRGAFILTVAGIISRMLGPVYRLPLASLLGDEGIGLYQMAYPIYTSILAISTAGIPVAISKLVAEKVAEGNQAQAMRVFRIALSLSGFSGWCFPVLCFRKSLWYAMFRVSWIALLFSLFWGCFCVFL